MITLYVLNKIEQDIHLKVVSPQRSDLILASHVPNSEADVFVLHCLNIEAWVLDSVWIC